MILAVALAVVLTVRPVNTSYCYTNTDHSEIVYISEHLFNDLVREKWCVQVYTEQDGTHVCVV